MSVINKPARRFSELLTTEVPSQRFWVEGVLPKKGKMLAGGQMKIGKSFIGLQFCKDLALGKPLFGHPGLLTETCKVLYCEQEVQESGQHSRIKEFFGGVDPVLIDEKLWLVSHNTNLKIDSRLGISHLEQYIKELQPNVVILDPASRMMEGDDSSNPDVRKFWDNLDDLIERYQDLELSFVVMHHYGKPPSSDKAKAEIDLLDPYNMRGASQWPGIPDSIMTLKRAGPKQPCKGWYLDTRITTGRSEGLDDFRLSVHIGGKMGVKYCLPKKAI